MQGFGEIAEQLRRQTVQVNRGGSGVIWSSDGLIVTNSHVIGEGRSRSPLSVELWDGRKLTAEVSSRDSRRDLATLRVQARGLPAATPGDSSALRAGELVMAVGNPLGFTGALTTGVVYAQGALRGLGRQDWVQAAVRLAPGNSGGPLADARGRVIGINTMVVRGGLGLAVPSNAVVNFLKNGPRGARLGVTLRPVATGLLVLEVEPGSPAAAASLLMGDVLTGVNGRAFTSFDDLSEALEASVHSSLTLQFHRGDQRAREVAVVVRARGVAA